MNILEAVKSGKRHRRKGWKHWWTYEEDNADFLKLETSYENILADDWEVEEAVIEISESDVKQLER